MAECSRHTYGLTAATTMSSVTVGKNDYCPSPTVLLDPSKFCTDDCVARKKVASRQGFAGIGCQGSGWGGGGGGGRRGRKQFEKVFGVPDRVTAARRSRDKTHPRKPKGMKQGLLRY